MNQEKTGKYIAQKRKQKAITQKQLAEQIGVTDKTVSKWENGNRMPDVSMMQNLCEILDVSLNELLLGEDILPENIGKSAEQNIIHVLEETKYTHVDLKKKTLGVTVGIVLIALALLGMIFVVGGSNEIIYYIDIRTLCFLLGLLVLVTAVSGSLFEYISVIRIMFHLHSYSKDEKKIAAHWIKRGRNTIAIVGLLTSMIAIVAAFGSLENISKIGPALSQAVLSILYTLILELICVISEQILFHNIETIEKKRNYKE